MIEQELNEIEMMEKANTNAQIDLDMGLLLEKLHQNPEFQEIFLKGYLEKYALRLIELKAHTGAQGERDQKFMGNQLDSIGHLKNYMGMIFEKARIAREKINTNNEEILKAEKTMKDGRA